jgi:heme A synthase
MEKMTFTRKGIAILVVSTLLCLLIEPIGYYRLYSGSFDSGWGGVVFSLVCIVIIISAKSYFPHKPESLRKWLYFMGGAFFLKILGKLIFRVHANTSVVLPFYGVATLFFVLSLLAAIVAYKDITAASESNKL